MGCSSCGSRINPPSQRIANIVYTPPTECTATEDEVKEVYRNLLCYAQEKKINVNVYLGQVLTMINRQNYCEFSLEEIKEYLDGYTC